MSQTINPFQFAQPACREDLPAPVRQDDWDDEVRQPAVGVALLLLSTVGTVFMITSAIQWIF